MCFPSEINLTRGGFLVGEMRMLRKEVSISPFLNEVYLKSRTTLQNTRPSISLVGPHVPYMALWH